MSYSVAEETQLAAETSSNEENLPEDPASPQTSPAIIPYSPTSIYEKKIARGWSIRVHPDLISQSELHDLLLERLNSQLYLIESVVPPKVLAKIKTIPIWIEKFEHHHPCMCYHTSREWLTENGMNPDKAGGVEIANAENFISWTIVQPWMVLHEMAHGYHDLFLEGGFDNAKVRSAYQNAVEQKLYLQIMNSRGTDVEAYAIKNHHEYFAELSEAFFGTNDFYPFVSAELSQYDPRGYQTIKELWASEVK